MHRDKTIPEPFLLGFEVSALSAPLNMRDTAIS